VSRTCSTFHCCCSVVRANTHAFTAWSTPQGVFILTGYGPTRSFCRCFVWASVLLQAQLVVDVCQLCIPTSVLQSTSQVWSRLVIEPFFHRLDSSVCLCQAPRIHFGRLFCMDFIPWCQSAVNVRAKPIVAANSKVPTEGCISCKPCLCTCVRMLSFHSFLWNLSLFS